MRYKPTFSVQVVFEKLKHWCAYQERSHYETRKKMREYKLSADDTEQIIADLITEGFLNEERFAMALARGKFRIKHWGRIKIKYELIKHRIPENVISKALSSLDTDEYNETINRIIEKKIEAGDTADAKLFTAVMKHLCAKGFESELASQELNKRLSITSYEP